MLSEYDFDICIKKHKGLFSSAQFSVFFENWRLINKWSWKSLREHNTIWYIIVFTVKESESELVTVTENQMIYFHQQADWSLDMNNVTKLESLFSEVSVEATSDVFQSQIIAVKIAGWIHFAYDAEPGERLLCQLQRYRWSGHIMFVDTNYNHYENLFKYSETFTAKKGKEIR